MQNFIENWIDDLLSVYEEIEEGDIYKNLIEAYLDDDSIFKNKCAQETAKSFFRSRFQSELGRSRGNKDIAYSYYNIEMIMFQFKLFAHETYRIAVLSSRNMVNATRGAEYLKHIDEVQNGLIETYNVLTKLLSAVKE